MNLAKDRFGKIGRQIPGQGLQARTIPSQMGETYGNLYLSEASIEAEQANRIAKANAQKIKARKLKVAQAESRERERVAKAKVAKQVQNYQLGARVNPLAQKLKHHYARQKMMGETAMVATSLYHAPSWQHGTTGLAMKTVAPADASGDSANMDIVPYGQNVDPVVWHADFRTHMIKGNPLTRDGVFGPAVTDFDRFVNGQDVNDARIGGGGNGTEQIAGGTMLGRYQGSRRPTNMGFDFSWDGISDAFSNILDQTSDNVVDALPDQLAQELQHAVAGGGSVQSSSNGTIIVNRPVTGTTTATMIPGVPNWALYTGIGLMGVGVLFALMNTMKRA